MLANRHTPGDVLTNPRAGPWGRMPGVLPLSLSRERGAGDEGPYHRSALDRGELESNDLVWVRLQAADLVRDRKLRDAEAVPDPGRVVHHVELLGLAQQIFALRLVRLGALVVQQLVHVGVFVA